MKTPLRGILATAAAMGLLALPLDAQDPTTAPDDSWISIDGTVEEVMPDAFLLSYGDGSITVEMDDGDRDADAYKLIEGDTVTVSGIMDDDFLETATIEASSVYVQNLGTYFYSSAFDEEDTFVTITGPAVPARTVIQGLVTDVSGDEFTLHTGLTDVTIETEDMLYDPLDDEGYQRIDVGDRVSVTGSMDYDLFEGYDFVAQTIITLEG